MTKENEILIAFRIPKALYDVIKKHAEEEENSVSGIVRKAIKEFFSKRDINWKNKIV
jgi:hypothetical protein